MSDVRGIRRRLLALWKGRFFRWQITVLTSMYADYIPMSVFSVEFGGKHSGFLVSLIDVFGYCGALLFNFFGGSIAQHYGWSVFLSGLLAITMLAGGCMVTFLTLDWHSVRRLGQSNTRGGK